MYAEAIAQAVKAWVPLSWEAFEDYRLGGVALSAQGLDVVRRLLRGEAVGQEQSGLAPREWRELMDLLERDETNP